MPVVVSAISDPVIKISRTLQKYKDSRIRAEDDLLKIMEKVKLDKTILLREKIGSIWGQTEKSDIKQVKFEIDKCKHRRHDLNRLQREAYLQLLQYLRERRTSATFLEKTAGDLSHPLPIKEEK